MEGFRYLGSYELTIAGDVTQQGIWRLRGLPGEWVMKFRGKTKRANVGHLLTEKCVRRRIALLGGTTEARRQPGTPPDHRRPVQQATVRAGLENSSAIRKGRARLCPVPRLGAGQGRSGKSHRPPCGDGNMVHVGPRRGCHAELRGL